MSNTISLWRNCGCDEEDCDICIFATGHWYLIERRISIEHAQYLVHVLQPLYPDSDFRAFCNGHSIDIWDD